MHTGTDGTDEPTQPDTNTGTATASRRSQVQMPEWQKQAGNQANNAEGLEHALTLWRTKHSHTTMYTVRRCPEPVLAKSSGV
jgi:hypothetical protein